MRTADLILEQVKCRSSCESVSTIYLLKATFSDDNSTDNLTTENHNSNDGFV